MTWYNNFMSGGLTENQKIFLNYFTEREFESLIPLGLILNKPTKTTIREACEIVQHWVDTGVWKYSVPEMKVLEAKEVIFHE